MEEGVPLLRRGPWVRVPGGSPRPTKDRHVKTGLVLAGRWFMSGAHPVNGYTLRVYLWSIDRWRKPVCDSRNSSTRRWGKNTRGGLVLPTGGFVTVLRSSTDQPRVRHGGIMTIALPRDGVEWAKLRFTAWMNWAMEWLAKKTRIERERDTSVPDNLGKVRMERIQNIIPLVFDQH